MSCIRFKFKSNLEYEKMTFDGMGLSLGELRGAIMKQKNIGQSNAFTLQVVDAQTNIVYKDDAEVIPRNASVVVKRVPVANAVKLPKTQHKDPSILPQPEKRLLSKQQQGPKATAAAPSAKEQLLQVADLANADATEEEKILAAISQSGDGFDPANYARFHSRYNMAAQGPGATGAVGGVVPPGLMRPPPPNYICYRCGQKGHWIKLCPTNGNPAFDNCRFKRPLGIPSTQVAAVGPNIPGAMLDRFGNYVVRTVDYTALTEGRLKGQPNSSSSTSTTTSSSSSSSSSEPKKQVCVPPEMVCQICNEMVKDAVVIPCCGESFCDDCIRTYLLENDFVCFKCKEMDVSPDSLVPNKKLREAVKSFRSKLAEEKSVAVARGLPKAAAAASTALAGLSGPIPIPASLATAAKATANLTSSGAHSSSKPLPSSTYYTPLTLTSTRGTSTHGTSTSTSTSTGTTANKPPPSSSLAPPPPPSTISTTPSPHHLTTARETQRERKGEGEGGDDGDDGGKEERGDGEDVKEESETISHVSSQKERHQGSKSPEQSDLASTSTSGEGEPEKACPKAAPSSNRPSPSPSRSPSPSPSPSSRLAPPEVSKAHSRSASPAEGNSANSSKESQPAAITVPISTDLKRPPPKSRQGGGGGGGSGLLPAPMQQSLLLRPPPVILPHPSHPSSHLHLPLRHHPHPHNLLLPGARAGGGAGALAPPPPPRPGLGGARGLPLPPSVLPPGQLGMVPMAVPHNAATANTSNLERFAAGLLLGKPAIASKKASPPPLSMEEFYRQQRMFKKLKITRRRSHDDGEHSHPHSHYHHRKRHDRERYSRSPYSMGSSAEGSVTPSSDSCSSASKSGSESPPSRSRSLSPSPSLPLSPPRPSPSPSPPPPPAHKSRHTTRSSREKEKSRPHRRHRSPESPDLTTTAHYSRQHPKKSHHRSKSGSQRDHLVYSRGGGGGGGGGEESSDVELPLSHHRRSSHNKHKKGRKKHKREREKERGGGGGGGGGGREHLLDHHHLAMEPEETVGGVEGGDQGAEAGVGDASKLVLYDDSSSGTEPASSSVGGSGQGLGEGTVPSKAVPSVCSKVVSVKEEEGSINKDAGEEVMLEGEGERKGEGEEGEGEEDEGTMEAEEGELVDIAENDKSKDKLSLNDEAAKAKERKEPATLSEPRLRKPFTQPLSIALKRKTSEIKSPEEELIELHTADTLDDDVSTTQAEAQAQVDRDTTPSPVRDSLPTATNSKREAASRKDREREGLLGRLPIITGLEPPPLGGDGGRLRTREEGKGEGEGEGREERRRRKEGKKRRRRREEVEREESSLSSAGVALAEPLEKRAKHKHHHHHGHHHHKRKHKKSSSSSRRHEHEQRR